MKDMPERVRAAIEAGIESRVKRERAESELLQKRQRARALRERMAALEKALEPKEVEAWCADLTEDAAGEVKTIEVNGEFGAEGSIRVVAPQEVAPSLAAGDVVAREVQAGAQAYFNAAILPGWQKFKPTYRAGTITRVDAAANVVDVDLDTARSSAQRLEINQSGSLSDVPVRYMTCDASAFEVGDRAIVEFQSQDWTQPVVIGFVERPRGCGVIVLARFGYNYWWVQDEWFPERYYEVAVQNNVQMCKFDPRTGEIENHVTHYVMPVSEKPRFTYKYNPFYWKQKVWIQRIDSENPYQTTLLAEDGETLSFGFRSGYWSFDGKRLVGTIPELDLAVIYSPSPEPGEPQLRYTETLGPVFGPIKSRKGKLAVHLQYDGFFLRIYDYEKAEILHTVSYYDGYALVDVAISNRYFAGLWFRQTSGNDYVVCIYSLATGEQLDESTVISAYGIAMTDAYLVAMDADGQPGSAGGCDIWRIEDGDLVRAGFAYPLALNSTLGDGAAGN